MISAVPSAELAESFARDREQLDQALTRFAGLGGQLQRQAQLWKEFEQLGKELEADLILCAAEKRPPLFDARERLADCARAADALVGAQKSAAAKTALRQRLKALHARIEEVSAGKGSGTGIYHFHPGPGFTDHDCPFRRRTAPDRPRRTLSGRRPVRSPPSPAARPNGPLRPRRDGRRPRFWSSRKSRRRRRPT